MRSGRIWGARWEGVVGRGRDTPGVTPGCRDGVVGTWRSLGSTGQTQVLPMTDALACAAWTREFRTLSQAKRKMPRGHLVAHSLEESGKDVVALLAVTRTAVGRILDPHGQGEDQASQGDPSGASLMPCLRFSTFSPRGSGSQPHPSTQGPRTVAALGSSCIWQIPPDGLPRPEHPPEGKSLACPGQTPASTY